MSQAAAVKMAYGTRAHGTRHTAHGPRRAAGGGRRHTRQTFKVRGSAGVRRAPTEWAPAWRTSTQAVAWEAGGAAARELKWGWGEEEEEEEGAEFDAICATNESHDNQIKRAA